MKLIIAALRRIARLFIDDGSFAWAIVVWLGGTTWLLPRLMVGAALQEILLFGGLASILTFGALRAVRGEPGPVR